MYKVYLDSILQDEKDIKDIAQAFEVSIVREDGFTETEQILREKSESTLEFTGDAYTYICGKRRDDMCGKILCSIVYVCKDGSEDTIFEGFITQNNVELYPAKCIGKITALKDNSFSGLLRDYIDTEVSLSGSRTKNCEPLDLIDMTITMYDDHTNLSSTVDVKSWDCFEVLRYIVAYFTNNMIDVRSDLLTGDTRYAITLGYNLHNTTGTTEQVYPKLSYSQLFTELRKKLRLYMVIEYDENNAPYLRVEDENYSYDDNEILLTIADIPVNATEKVDYARLFNSVKVGSTQNDLIDPDAVPPYTQNALTAWNDETYNSCSNCIADKNSEGVVLDLVSNYIINSNLIYEGCALGAGADYSYDTNIFLFEYETYSATNVSSAKLTLNGSDYIYNDGFINENVINNWLGYTPLCVSLSNNTANYFLATQDQQVRVTGTAPSNIIESGLELNNTIVDSGSNLSLVDGLVTFTIPVDGQYRFKIKTDTYISSLDCLNSEDESGYQLGIAVNNSPPGSGDFYYSPIEYYPNYSDNIPLEFITPLISFVAGDIVQSQFKMTLSANCGSPGSVHIFNNNEFSLYYDASECDTVTNDQTVKPYTLEFEYPICHTDYMAMKNNKRGIVRVGEYDYYIKELKYIPQKLSQFKLIGAESICNNC